jgi:hypothetical protein
MGNPTGAAGRLTVSESDDIANVPKQMASIVMAAGSEDPIGWSRQSGTPTQPYRQKCHAVADAVSDFLAPRSCTFIRGRHCEI